jgi:lipopolysaccharide/colanic/teichoic acid biosynthesis glycosyltransferase
MLYKSFLKRFVDVLAALIGLLVLAPLLLAVTILLSIANRGKPFFFQTRPGKNEQLFKIIKFKTMTDAKDHQGNLLEDAKRLTTIGNIVRKTSLDEIPQLINVLKGDMSLIGPRPLLVEYLKLYNETQKKRHLIRPGITGWAQVHGRNTITWEHKFEYDVWYVENYSFLVDVKIMVKTIQKVIQSEGVNAGKNMTMNRFKGN